MIHLFLADGFEEIEAIATLDILRRCGLDVQTVSVMKTRTVTGAHNLRTEADTLLADADLTQSEALVLPGGMPGATNLAACDALGRALTAQAGRGGVIAAICAAPLVPGRLGLLQGRRATCYPGFESELTGADVTPQPVVADDNLITGNGPAAAADFAFAIAARFVSQKHIGEIRRGMGFA